MDIVPSGLSGPASEFTASGERKDLLNAPCWLGDPQDLLPYPVEIFPAH